MNQLTKFKIKNIVLLYRNRVLLALHEKKIPRITQEKERGKGETKKFMMDLTNKN